MISEHYLGYSPSVMVFALSFLLSVRFHSKHENVGTQLKTQEDPL